MALRLVVVLLFGGGRFRGPAGAIRAPAQTRKGFAFETGARSPRWIVVMHFWYLVVFAPGSITGFGVLCQGTAAITE